MIGLGAMEAGGEEQVEERKGKREGTWKGVSHNENEFKQRQKSAPCLPFKLYYGGNETRVHLHN